SGQVGAGRAVEAVGGMGARTDARAPGGLGGIRLNGLSPQGAVFCEVDPPPAEAEIFLRGGAGGGENPACPRGNAGDRARAAGEWLGTLPPRDGAGQGRATHRPEPDIRAAHARRVNRPEPTSRGAAFELLYSGIGVGNRDAAMAQKQ